MKATPFCLSIDGSNDTGTEKMNPMTVKIFDVNRVQHRFLDMCTTTGRETATAETIFNKMDAVLTKLVSSMEELYFPFSGQHLYKYTYRYQELIAFTGFD